MTKNLKKALEKVVNAGYTVLVVKDEESDDFENWFYYHKEGVGTGYIQEEFAGFHVSSKYVSDNVGTGAVYGVFPSISHKDLENALRYKIEPEHKVKFITYLKDLLVTEDIFFPDIRIIDKGGEKTPFDMLEKLNGVYIVKHGPTYMIQLYNKMPKVDEKAIVVKIENGDFIEIKGERKEQIEMLKKAFPYVEKSQLEKKLISF